MTGDFLISRGRLFVLAALLLSSVSAFSQNIDATIDSDRIALGESATLRHSISDADGDIKPLSVPSVPGLQINYVGMQRSFQFVNGKSWKGIIFTFSVSPERQGNFRIPPFVYDIGGKKISTREISLRVSKAAPAARDMRSGAPARIKTSVELARKRVYAGEPLVMRYFMLSSGLRNVKYVGKEQQSDSKGFVVKEMEEGIEDRTVIDEGAELVKSHLNTSILIPAETGHFEVGGGTSIISFDAEGGFFGDMKRQYRLSFESLQVDVVPIPKKNAPASFKGDVGNFTISAEYDSKPVKAFEEKKITVTIKGTGNLISVTKPSFENELTGARVLSEDGESNISVKGGTLEGDKKIIYTVIPEKAGSLNLGSVILTFFNPENGKFENARSSPVEFSVLEGDKTGRGGGFDSDSKDRVDFNILYIIISVLIVGGIIVLVVFWERKRMRLAAEMAAPRPVKEEEKKKTSQANDHIRGISSAISKMERNAFLSASDRALAELSRSAEMLSVDNDHRKVISELKEKVYSWRFGGVNFSQEDMENMLEKIKLVKSEMEAAGR